MRCNRADGALADVLNGLETGITGDYLRRITAVAGVFGGINGGIGVEDLLGNIFGKFCVGK